MNHFQPVEMQVRAKMGQLASRQRDAGHVVQKMGSPIKKGTLGNIKWC